MVAKEENNEGHKIDKLFQIMLRQGASDLHLKYHQPPILRIGGNLQALKSDPLTDTQIRKLTYEMISKVQIARFEETGSLDFSYEFAGGERVRVNLYKQRAHISMAARLVQSKIPSFEELHLPPVMERIAGFPQGLVLVCGPTGCGKSTTLAAIIDYMNTNRRCHILTIEDPIEFSFTDRNCYIDQREVGLDVPSWDAALKYSVREDPDVIMVGEMRDPDTFQAGITCAQTGHLVLGTLHAPSAGQTFARILDMFPLERHDAIREDLASNLRAIMAQMLLPSIKEGVRRVPAVEVMLSTPTIRDLIRRGDENRIPEIIRNSTAEGMIDMTQSIAKLIQEDYVLRKVGLQLAPNKERLQMELRGISVDAGRIIG